MAPWIWGVIAIGCIVYVAVALVTLGARADERTREMMKRKEEE